MDRSPAGWMIPRPCVWLNACKHWVPGCCPHQDEQEWVRFWLVVHGVTGCPPIVVWFESLTFSLGSSDRGWRSLAVLPESCWHWMGAVGASPSLVEHSNGCDVIGCRAEWRGPAELIGWSNSGNYLTSLPWLPGFRVLLHGYPWLAPSFWCCHGQCHRMGPLLDR
jgi:hypothetical protein